MTLNNMKKLSLTEVLLLTLIISVSGWGLFSGMKLYAKDTKPLEETTVLILRTGPKPPGLDDQNQNMSIPGQQMYFRVYVPTNGPTNIDFRAYLADVQFTNSLPQIATPSGLLSSNYFVTNADNSFTGNQTVALTPGTWTEIPFRLSLEKFVDEEQGDILLAILPFKTAATNSPLQGAAIFSIDSPVDGIQY